MGVTIKDVAKKTGLSITTVSLVLNKKQSRIPEKTRQIVESAALELNYSPNNAAISLATKRTGVIALVLPENSHYFPADLLIPAEHACRNSGFTLLVKLVEDDDESSLDSINTLLQHGVDGIIFDPSRLGMQSVGKYMDLLAQTKTPIVSLGGVGAHILPNSIISDHRRAGYMAAMHLLELGHRRIGCIAGRGDSPVARDFTSGYRDALEEKCVDEEWVVEKTADAAWLSGSGLTAVAVGSLGLAQAVYRQAYRAGVSVPEQLSLVAYGDYDHAGEMIVAPATVSMHFDRFARKAVSLIKRLGKTEPPVTPEILAPSLVVRESTKPFS